jgi:hypothetical protein
MMVISDTYDITALATDYVTSTVTGVQARDHEIVHQDIFLYGYCNIFADDIESGNLGWTADPPWAISDENYHSPTHCWTDSPGGDYDPFVDISLTSQVFDLTDHHGTKLGFSHAYSLQDGYAFGRVEYSDDGVNWTEAASYNGEYIPPPGPWSEEQIALPGLDDEPNAQVRFRLQTLYVPNDGWYIDDVVLYGGGPACITPASPTVEFTSSSPIELGATMVFANLTSGTPPFDWYWDFGDGGGTSTEMYPEYTYLGGGTFDVTLVATNTLGADSISHEVVVVEQTYSVYVPLVFREE